jgi:hypothetical protein
LPGRHAQQGGALHGDTGEEGALSHQHAQLADEVALLDHEDDSVVAAVDEKDAAGQYQIQVVRVTGIPQDLARIRVKHLPGRPQQRQHVLAEYGHAKASIPSR